MARKQDINKVREDFINYLLKKRNHEYDTPKITHDPLEEMSGNLTRPHDSILEITSRRHTKDRYSESSFGKGYFDNLFRPDSED